MISYTSDNPWQFNTTKLKNFIKRNEVEIVNCEYNLNANLWKFNPGTIFQFGKRVMLVLKHERRESTYKVGDHSHSLHLVELNKGVVGEYIDIQLSWLMVEKYKIVGRIKDIEKYVSLRNK